MSQKIPILIIIPHGGYNIPEELTGYDSLTPAELFFESDGGANRIFDFREKVDSVISTDISRLFVDMDRNYKDVYPVTKDGVIKKTSSMNRPVFRENFYPDEIAISNIIKRYYYPFHQNIKQALEEKPSIILECHTHMPVGPANAPDRGMPRPLVITGYTADNREELARTATADMALGLASLMGKALEKEGDTVTSAYSLDNKHNTGYIINTYGKSAIPMLYISISRSLFLTDRYFDIEGMRIDTNRLGRLNSIVYGVVEKFFRKIR
jgi:formiminoglutamase